MRDLIKKKIFNWYFSRSAMPYWTVLGMDVLIVFFSITVGYFLEKTVLDISAHKLPAVYGTLIMIVIFMFSFKFHHTYVGVIRYSSYLDLLRVSIANTAAILACGVLALAFRHITFILVPGPVCLLTVLVLSILLMTMMRICVKYLYQSFNNSANLKNVFIYGNKDAAVALAKSIRNVSDGLYAVKGFISPDGDMVGQYLLGARVYEDKPGLVDEMKKMGAGVLMVSPVQMDHFREQNAMINDFSEAGIKMMIMPKPELWNGKIDIHTKMFREVEIEDLLPREQIKISLDAIAKQLCGKSVLITGAAGSIGLEMVKQIAAFAPSDLVLIDQAETPMHEVRLMMKRRFPGINATTLVASITNQPCMEAVFACHRPQYVFHAAAYKHVPMMEDNPAVAVQNNVVGTRIIADLAVKYGCSKFVMISTDKAVNPTNVMGCSKCICEMYCRSLNNAIQDGKVAGATQFVTTRFGNVLGSSGSVIPIFKEQIRKGGPITVTDPEIIRYFMLIPEACKLVLEAGTIGKGGEIFIFDMGKPVKILDLAKRMIALSGAEDIKIEFSGLRDGEKLYEELLADKETTIPTRHPKIKIAKVAQYEYGNTIEMIDRLVEVSEHFDSKAIVDVMKEIVPEYHPANSHYE